MLDQLLEQARNMAVDLKNELDEARRKTAEINQNAADLRIKKDAFDSKVAQLDEREKAIAQSENLINAVEEQKRLKQENAVLSQELHEQVRRNRGLHA